MKWKFYSLAFVAGMSILTACSSDDNNDNDGNGGNGNGNEIENGTILKGTITSDVTLAAGNTYKLSGAFGAPKVEVNEKGEKKITATLNDVPEEDAVVVGRLAIAAARYAKAQGFAEDGYRIVMNCNGNGGQTVFQIHLHLLAGAPLGRFGTPG